MITGLHLCDSPAWQLDVSYSPAVASALRSAFADLAAGAYTQAHARIEPYFVRPMAAQQRLRVCYALGLTSIAQGLTTTAQAVVDEGLEMSAQLEDYFACAQFARLQFASLNDSQMYGAALTYLDVGLEALALCDMPAGQDAGVLDFELGLRLGYASCAFLVAHYEDCLRQVEAAGRLARGLPATTQALLRLAEVDWVAALVERWRGNGQEAYVRGQRALQIYESMGAGDAAARMHVVLADILLDTIPSAARAAGMMSRLAYDDTVLDLARAHLTSALPPLESSADTSWTAMASLSSVRLSRLTQRGFDTLALLQSIEDTARKREDIPLLGQVYTSFGAELSAQQQVDAAKNCYRKAIALLTAGPAPALAVWPRRALLLEEEFTLT